MEENNDLVEVSTDPVESIKNELAELSPTTKQKTGQIYLISYPLIHKRE